jgi:hypothetical protein
MNSRYTFICLGSFQRRGNIHFNAKEQMRNFEGTIWKPPRPNRKVQRKFLTGINHSQYERESDEDDSSDEEDCRVEQPSSQPEACVSSPEKPSNPAPNQGESNPGDHDGTRNSSSNRGERKIDHQTLLSSDKLNNFWKPIILAARNEREFFPLLEKLKPIILDNTREIEDTVAAIGEYIVVAYGGEAKRRELEQDTGTDGTDKAKDSTATVPVTPPDGIFEM